MPNKNITIELVGHGPASRFDGQRFVAYDLRPIEMLVPPRATIVATYDSYVAPQILRFLPRIGSWYGDEGQVYFDWDGRIRE